MDNDDKKSKLITGKNKCHIKLKLTKGSLIKKLWKANTNENGRVIPYLITRLIIKTYTYYKRRKSPLMIMWVHLTKQSKIYVKAP